MVTDPLRWVSQAPANGPGKVVNTRRSHKKSRQGCFTCKARRVKCDETRPICKGCSYRATQCEYGSSIRTGAKSSLPTPAASVVDERTTKASPAAKRSDLLNDRLDNVSFASEATLGLDVFAKSIANLTRAHATTRTSPNTLPFLLHHFSTTSYATLGSYTGQRVIKEQIPNLAMQYPFLLDAILAFSASHLAYLKQGPTGCRSQGGNMSIVASWHIGRGLRGYGQKIGDFRSNASTPNRHDERKSMDALVATCLILTSLFYHVGRSDEGAQLWSSLWVPETPQITPHQAQLMPPRGCNPDHLRKLSPGGPASLLKCVPNGLSAVSYITALHTIKASCEWLTNVTGILIILSLTQFREHVPHSIWYPFLTEASEQHANEAARVETSITSSQRQPVQYSLDCETINHPHLPNSNSPACSPSPSHQNITLPHLHRLLDLILTTPHLHQPPPHPQSQPQFLYADLTPLLTHLLTLLPLRPANLAIFSRIISFPSFFPSDSFPTLVAARDPVALLVLGYWFGMLEGVPHWWCQDRGRREGVAVEVWGVMLVRGLVQVEEAGEGEGKGGRDGSGGEYVRDMGWGYRRQGISEGDREAKMDRKWRGAVRDAVEEFIAWRQERGLGG